MKKFYNRFSTVHKSLHELIIDIKSVKIILLLNLTWVRRQSGRHLSEVFVNDLHVGQLTDALMKKNVQFVTNMPEIHV